MPNWCSNEVTVDGTSEDIQKFKEECFTFVSHKGEAVLDFNKVLPEPDYEKPKWDGTHNKGFQTELHSEHPDWYNWRMDNWGTKWNLIPNKGGDLIGWYFNQDLDKPSFSNRMGARKYDRISMVFDTAWNPPHGIYDAIVEKYPDLDVGWFYREDNTQMVGWLPE